MRLYYGNQTALKPDDSKTEPHVCRVCQQPFFAAPNAFLSHEWCDPCYVRLKTKEMRLALGIE